MEINKENLIKELAVIIKDNRQMDKSDDNTEVWYIAKRFDIAEEVRAKVHELQP